MAVTASASDQSSPAKATLEIKAGGATIRPKRKGKASALLRDYYGLGGGLSTANEDPTDPDSASFDKKAAYRSIVASSTLPQLLKRECDLLTELRELDGERQSLVYNHHHELIAASETIAKMKARAESLDGSLDALRASFSNISQLFSDLALPRPPPASCSATSDATGSAAEAKPIDAASPGVHPVEQQSNSNTGQTRQLQVEKDVLDVRIGEGSDAKVLKLDSTTQKELLMIVDLPMRLRDALVAHDSSAEVGADGPVARAMQVTTEGLTEAEKLWGQREPIISKWIEAGINDVKIIANECRVILREASAASSR